MEKGTKRVFTGRLLEIPDEFLEEPLPEDDSFVLKSKLDRLRAERSRLMASVQDVSDDSVRFSSDVSDFNIEDEEDDTSLMIEQNVLSRLMDGTTTRKKPLSMTQSIQKLESSEEEIKFRSVLFAHRLVGKTIFPFGDGSLLIRFEPSAFGEYFETFFMVLENNSSSSDRRKLHVSSHSCPPFIPVSSIADKMIKDVDDDPACLRLFTDNILSYLISYVSRRYSINRIKEDLSDVVTLKSTTSSFHESILEFQWRRCLVVLTLKHTQMLYMTPDRVFVSIVEGEMPFADRLALENQWINEYPHEVAEAMFR